MLRPVSVLLLLAMLGVVPAHAGDDFCVDRPGLGTPPCVAEPGHPIIEMGLADLTRDRNADMTSDTLVLAETLMRVGVGGATEFRFGFDGFGHVVSTDRAGRRMRAAGAGDVTLGVRHNFRGTDGPVAVQAFVTLPVGGRALGAGDWGAGVLLPVAFDLSDVWSINLTPGIDAAVDGDRSGRHLAYGSAAGVSAKIGSGFTATIDAKLIRDDDPDDASTSAQASASLAWQPHPDTQFDVGAIAGFNRDTPDVELYVGVAQRF